MAPKRNGKTEKQFNFGEEDAEVESPTLDAGETEDASETTETQEPAEAETDEDPTGQTFEVTPRQQQRRDRGINRVQQAREEADEERRKRIAAEEEASRLRIQATQAMQAQPQIDQRRKALDEAYGAVDAFNREWEAVKGRQLSDADLDSYRKRARELDERVHMARDALNRPQHDPQQAAHAAHKAALHAEFADVVSNPQALTFAKTEFERMVGIHGKPNNAQTAREAFLVARQSMPGRRPPPTQQERQQFSAMPQGSGAGGGAKKSIKVTKEIVTMATNLYPNLPRNQAVQKWVNEVGSDD